VTAPPPSGALKAEGRRVVRADDEEVSVEPPPASQRGSRKKIAAIGAFVGLLAVLGGFFVLRGGDGDGKPMTAAELRAREAPTEKMPTIPGAPAMGDVPLFGPTPLSTTEQVVMPPAAISGNPAAGPAPAGAGPSDEEGEDEAKAEAVAQRKWGTGDVKNPSTLRIKMDGPLSGIQGQDVDGGFAITVPGRKSTASAAGLARKDKRIETVDIVNKEDGAVVTVKFRGGEIPVFQAQAKGDRLEIAISGEGSGSGSGGSDDAPAKKKVASKSKSKSKSKAKSDSKKKKKAD
jgi:hypothetical protein